MVRKDVNELLAKALDSPGFRQAWLQVSEEKATRPVRPCRCTVVEIPETAQPHDFGQITPGTVTAFVAREGDPLLPTLTKAISGNDSKAFGAAIDQITQMEAELTRKITGGGIPAGSQQQPFPSFAEISYAQKALTSQVFIDDLLRVNVHPFPYNGGHLDRKAFSMIEYYRAGAGTPLTCVLLIRQPKLGEIEREALRLVPSGSSANNIGAEVVAPFTPALLEATLITAEYAAEWLYNEFVRLFVAFLHGTTTTAALPDAVLKSEEFQKVLKSLPPEVTAAELVRLRTDLLLQGPRK